MGKASLAESLRYQELNSSSHDTTCGDLGASACQHTSQLRGFGWAWGLGLEVDEDMLIKLELDNHHKYGNDQVRYRAREANRFLNRTINARKHDPRIPLRVQKLWEMSEHVRANSTKRDDQHILDCCLNFRTICQEMWLWTKDQIFGTIVSSAV
jgi:hypothetical protein